MKKILITIILFISIFSSTPMICADPGWADNFSNDTIAQGNTEVQ